MTDRDPRVIATNGIGKPCTSHLNLRVTLADAWAVDGNAVTAEWQAALRRRAEQTYRPSAPYAGSEK